MLYILLALIAIILIASYFTYVFTFRARKDRARDPFILPDREEYTKDQKTMRDLIMEMNEVSFESVYIKSFDGLTLTAR
ncbi:MAG: hypothetical protein IJO53_06065, partial [Clostridia bacterium]|nr:hypothetical protein [Clostridia bacterium]